MLIFARIGLKAVEDQMWLASTFDPQNTYTVTLASDYSCFIKTVDLPDVYSKEVCTNRRGCSFCHRKYQAMLRFVIASCMLMWQSLRGRHEPAR